MKILLKLLVVEVDKEGRRGEEDKAIERKDKSTKRLLITSARIWAEEFMACLSGIMQNNLFETTRGTLLLKSLIKSALISPTVVIIKFASDLLRGPASA